MSPSPTGWPPAADAAPTAPDAPTGATGGARSSTAPEDAGALADRVRAAVLAVPGVVALHPGPVGEVATLLPGRRVPGVRLGPDGAVSEVHVVVSVTRPLTHTAAAVHRAVLPLAPDGLDVVVGDVATLDEQVRRERDARTAGQQQDGPRGT